MSHASLLVALSPKNLRDHGGDIEKAITEQMAPFDENEQGGWFADGSRWDWWVIGGRYSARFAPPDYDPTKDPANYEQCFVCEGTGIRTDDLGNDHRRRDPKYTCNGCGDSPFKGRSLKHLPEWKPIGNIILRKDVSLEKYQAMLRTKAAGQWPDLEKDLAKHAASPSPILSFSWGIKDEDLPMTKEKWVERVASKPISFYAFLKDREWHEGGRMGWFGSSVKTECELKAEDEGKTFTGRCLHKCEKTGAKIMTWSHAKDTEERWAQLFYRRFIQELPDDYTLVVVDYHV